MSQAINVVISCENQQQANVISQALLENKLVACVQHCQIESHYHWQGQIEQATEIRLDAKSHSDKFEQIQQLVTQLHSYECVEVIATDITHANQDYLQWLTDALR